MNNDKDCKLEDDTSNENPYSQAIYDHFETKIQSQTKFISNLNEMTKTLNLDLSNPSDIHNSSEQKFLKKKNEKKKAANSLNENLMSGFNKKFQNPLLNKPLVSTNLRDILQNNENLIEQKMNLNLCQNNKKKTKLYLFLGKFFLLKKFVKILKFLSFKVTLKYLNENHFKLINDKSFCDEIHFTNQKQKIKAKNEIISNQFYNKTSFLQKITVFFKKAFSFLTQIIPIFDPNQNIINIWNLFVFLSLLFFLLIFLWKHV